MVVRDTTNQTVRYIFPSPQPEEEEFDPKFRGQHLSPLGQPPTTSLVPQVTPEVPQSIGPNVVPQGLQEVADFARRQIGTPYGSGRNRFDCQTLVMAAYRDRYGMNFARDPNGQPYRVPNDRGNHIAYNHFEKVADLDWKGGRFEALAGNLQEVRPGMMVGLGHEYNGIMGQSHYHMGIVGQVIRDQAGNIVDFTVIHASGYYTRNGSPRGRGVMEERASDIARSTDSDPRRNRLFILRPNQFEETQRARAVEQGRIVQRSTE